MRKLLLGAVLLAGCSRAPQLPEGKALYESPSGGFSIQGPADWRVDERVEGTHRVTFYGPPPAVEAISIYRHEGEKAASHGLFQSLASSRYSSRKTEWKGRPAREILAEQKAPVIHGRGGNLLRVRTVVIEDAKGVWALVHTAPVEKSSTAIFDAAVESFQPNP